MAERLVPRRWPGFDSRSRPDLRLEWKRWLFSVTLRQGARSQGLQLRFQNDFKKLHLCRQRFSRILRHGNTALNEQLNLVDVFER
jgi:hypothetical protein